jgi:hypothetical protein
VVLAAWDVSALATGAGAMMPACAAAACGTVAWIAIDRLVPTVADLGRGAAWALGAALLALAVRIASAPRSRPHAPPPASANAAVWAAAALVAAVVVVFREALLHGRVLSQADLLYSVFPWRAAMPDGLVIGNRLLADIPLVFYPFLTQVADAFSTGTFPLWSTRLYAGHPFFASVPVGAAVAVHLDRRRGAAAVGHGSGGGGAGRDRRGPGRCSSRGASAWAGSRVSSAPWRSRSTRSA